MSPQYRPSGSLSKQLHFALEQLRSSQWERFEQFASAYLVVDYPSLRTVGRSGDRGRDAEVVVPPDEPHVVIQYTIAEDWRTKAKGTAKAIHENFPDARVLVYATNQRIGAAADDLRVEIGRDFGLFLDVRDISFFVERCELDTGRAAAADELIADIAQPILAERELVEGSAPALSTGETRAACVHLALEWRDATRDKGLTKLCFEALVRSVLRGTSTDNLLSRKEIRERVAALVSATEPERAGQLTDGALQRLTRRGIQHWTATDEFCLSRAERERARDNLAAMQLKEQELLEALGWEVGRTYEAFGVPIPQSVTSDAYCVRIAVEILLLRQGEMFAAAVTTGAEIRAGSPDIKSAVQDAMSSVELTVKHAGGRSVEIFAATVGVVLTEPSEPIQDFFRAYADAYTLFAFLRETPDVQSAVVKLHSIGEIWLDASMVLPVMAETLIDDAAGRRFTNMLAAARECGLKLRVTEGVLEELESNTWNTIQYARKSNTWRSTEPFLAKAFVLSGRQLAELPTWMAEFRGTIRPREDLGVFLTEEHGIEVGSLERYSDAASTELRAVVQEAWHTAHERRRQEGADPNTLARLVAHDVENYLGVVKKRTHEDANPYGYSTWWLTLDHVAYGVHARLKEDFGREAPDSPVMSPDFMVSYLAIGPLRARLSRETEGRLPLTVVELQGSSFPELLAEAQKVREAMSDQSDRVVRREVRTSRRSQAASGKLPPGRASGCASRNHESR